MSEFSPLTKKKVKPKGSAVSYHLLLCNHSPSFEDFSVLTKKNKKFLLELKESLLIMRDKPEYSFTSCILLIRFLIVTSLNFIGKNANMFEWAETGSPQLLIIAYNNSVLSCDDIIIDQFFILFSSLSTRLLLF